MNIYYPQKIKPVFRVTDLINASYYNFPENFSFEGEAHNFWELIYVDRGQIVVQHGENSYMLKVGEMIFCKPNVFHKSWVWQGKPASAVNISFVAEGLDMEVFENKILVLNAEERQCMSAIVREASRTYLHFENIPVAVKMERFEKSPYGSEQIICNRLEELIIYACRSERNISIDNRLISSVSKAEDSDFSSWIQLYLREHMSEKITLQTIAKENCVSVSKLKRVFRQETGKSAIAFLTDIRINEAKRLIAEKKYTFSQIAEKVGFESIHYFSYVFKKQTGMTASEYLKLLHKSHS